ncbi:MAG: hypothetical protein IAE77_08040 [Prosthecobacter sp.]|uniref:hypothetical protein n=1 Tax=Prosthecobacter sp. TaxID=1965333 RepID=UPI001A008524|nr:hypothetical protein [Prosthecobacter sp.]MBE2283397.1 hypothetical protein [Prosthecobacter sp.]
MTTDIPAHPAEHALSRFVDKAETMARDEPAKAVAAAVGAGVVLNILPLRFLVASASAVTLTMLRPALLTLGVIKAFELCTCHRKPSHE